MLKINQMISSRCIGVNESSATAATTSEKSSKKSNWDLTSSLTGTVKRRPSSLESCKSSTSVSPTTSNEYDDKIDFPHDSNILASSSSSHRRSRKNDKDFISSCKINSQKCNDNGKEISHKNYNDDDLLEEIACGSSSIRNEDEIENEKTNKKIDKRSSKLGKLAESAKKSFSSKLKLPNRVSLTLSPRRRATTSNSNSSSKHNKLSLSQLERQNNLFIRDGQQHPTTSSSESSDVDKQGELKKINKLKKDEHENGGENKKNNLISTANATKIDEKNNRQKIINMDNKTGGSGSKKSSSLIPSFLGKGNNNNNNTNGSSNHIKIPTTSSVSVNESIRKTPSTTNVVVEKLTKTGNKFKELYRDFPSSSSGSLSAASSPAKRQPPPYRPPPTPPLPTSSQSSVHDTSGENYEEIDVINDNNIVVVEQQETMLNIEAEGKMKDEDLLSKPEYSSNVFKNIPVRQRKGQVSHMENYCLFDPSVDFCNEKKLMKKKLIEARIPSEFELSRPIVDGMLQTVTVEDQIVYDISELDERQMLLAHHNYYEIDPDLLLEDEQQLEMENEIAFTVSQVNQIEIQQQQKMQQNQNQKRHAQQHVVAVVAARNEKGKIYSNTLSTSSDSTSSTSQTSTNSSSTTTSSDYPSMFNSVIETTHSSNVESTDDNDSNGYGKVKFDETINQAAVENNDVACGSVETTTSTANNESALDEVANNATLTTTTGATKKKSPQVNRIIPRPLSSSHRESTSKSSSSNTKTKSTKSRSSSSNPIKSSSSLPQLKKQSNSNMNFVIDNTSTIQLRKQQQHSRRGVGRPMSGNSDDRDSGFLSPVTPPESSVQHVHITPNVIIKGQNDKEKPKNNESTLLNQCDNVQQLIEVSSRFLLCIVVSLSPKHISCCVVQSKRLDIFSLPYDMMLQHATFITFLHPFKWKNIFLCVKINERENFLVFVNGIGSQ